MKDMATSIRMNSLKSCIDNQTSEIATGCKQRALNLINAMSDIVAIS